MRGGVNSERIEQLRAEQAARRAAMVEDIMRLLEGDPWAPAYVVDDLRTDDDLGPALTFKQIKAIAAGHGESDERGTR